MLSQASVRPRGGFGVLSWVCLWGGGGGACPVGCLAGARGVCPWGCYADTLLPHPPDGYYRGR